MIRPLRTVLPLFLVAFSLFAAGCHSFYRPIYSPGKSNYKKPPEKREAVGDLLPPESTITTPSEPPQGLPEQPAPQPSAGSGMLDTPAIPGLPQ